MDFLDMSELDTSKQVLALLISLPVVYSLMLWLGRWLKRKHGVQLRWPYHLFSVCLAIYGPAKLLHIYFPDRRELAALTCILGAGFVVTLMDRYVWDLYFKQRHRIKLPRFLDQVATLVVFVTAIILILGFGYRLPLKGFFLAPGILAVMVGVAMQNVLSNIIAGISLQAGKTFKDGDWIFVNNQYAQVIDINWRSTRLRTIDDVSIEVPNSDIAKQVVVNLNLPTRRHAMRIPVSIDYSVPPTRVKDILLHASANAKGVAPEPKPQVFLKNFGEYAVEYDIKFWMDDHNQYNDVCDAIRTNVWYGLHRHGIKIPFPIRTVHLERQARSKEEEVQSTARLMLRQQPLFKSLSDIQLDALLPRGRIVHFGRDEKIIQQGENGDSMFILVSGEANVVVERNNSPTHVASLRGGDCFGEMSLLTGERRSATILAHTDCEVVEIGKPVLAKSLKENPDLLCKLSELLAQRQMETEGIIAANTRPTVVEAKQAEYTNGFIRKLRVFFQL
ncbi:MAG TPA: mechanosensitive ion channel family protein [Candidatus Cybelea sp.]|jgi:small-conductance mechanosensitive channel|nr:mechanosensitive ion channel family protein [Candidatus Cybelea sp.]